MPARGRDERHLDDHGVSAASQRRSTTSSGCYERGNRPREDWPLSSYSSSAATAPRYTQATRTNSTSNYSAYAIYSSPLAPRNQQSSGWGKMETLPTTSTVALQRKCEQPRSRPPACRIGLWLSPCCFARETRRKRVRIGAQRPDLVQPEHAEPGRTGGAPSTPMRRNQGSCARRWSRKSPEPRLSIVCARGWVLRRPRGRPRAGSTSPEASACRSSGLRTR